MSNIPQGTLQELVCEFGGPEDHATYRMLMRYSRQRADLLKALTAVAEVHCKHTPGECSLSDKAWSTIAANEESAMIQPRHELRIACHNDDAAQVALATYANNNRYDIDTEPLRDLITDLGFWVDRNGIAFEREVVHALATWWREKADADEDAPS